MSLGSEIVGLISWTHYLTILDKELWGRGIEKAAKNSEYVSFDSNFALLKFIFVPNPKIAVP